MVHLMGLSKAGWVFCGIVCHPFNYVTVHMVCNQWLHLSLSFNVQGATRSSICEVPAAR